jgi:hypothetical protein
LRKLKCKNFPILKIFNLSKTQNFLNSLKFLVFILDIYVQIFFFYKLHKESTAIICLDLENPLFRLGIWLDFLANIYPVASGVRDGSQKLNEHKFGICQHFVVLSMSLYFGKQYDWMTNFVTIIGKHCGWIQDGGSKSDFIA